ncbi:MAG: peroxiredoxin [Conexivisphaera sp.]|jgi:peroxiredoxin Q/BCP
MECPREGEKAPEVEGIRIDGSPTVIYFFPKAFTQGCTRELDRFVELLGEFERLGARIFGVSADGPGTMEKFASKHGARPPLILVPDPGKRIISAYCAGSERGSGARRVTFVVGPDGRIAAVLEKLKRAEDHADAALEAVRKLVGR